MGTEQIIIPVIGGIGGAVLLWLGFRRMHRYRLIQDTPQSKIRSMAMGLVEIHGNVQAKTLITTPFSKTKCVYYRYVIEEYRAHHHTDSKGRSSTTYSWDTVASGSERTQFLAKDETGTVMVEPKGADFNVSVRKAFLQRSGMFGAIGTIVSALKAWNSKKPLDISAWNLTPIDPHSVFTFGASVGDRRYYEYYITDEDPLFVMGTAATATGGVVIKKGENEPTFIISDKSEKDLVRSIGIKMWLFLGIGGVLLAGAIIFLIIALGGG